MEMLSHIFSRRVPCPVCSQTPLIFVSCNSCASIFAWCAEDDYPVGIYDGIDLRELGLGETPDWARNACPVCRTDSMIYSTRSQVKSLGFAASEIFPKADS